MKPTNQRIPGVVAALTIILAPASPGHAAEGAANRVDFAYAPPEWQTAICLPDDPHKSLVERSGQLLYHYGQGGREFATRVGVQVASNAVWQQQALLSPRAPVVRTLRAADGLEIVEDTFAVTDLRPTRGQRHQRRRQDRHRRRGRPTGRRQEHDPQRALGLCRRCKEGQRRAAGRPVERARPRAPGRHPARRPGAQ